MYSDGHQGLPRGVPVQIYDSTCGSRASMSDHRLILEQLLHQLPPIVLASASPRRTDLLASAGIPHRIVVRSIDEAGLSGATAADTAMQIARAKFAACEDLTRQELVICADTVVELDGQVLGKPVDAQEAREMLRSLSGRMHAVHTAVVMGTGGARVETVATTRVWFRWLPDDWIDAWLATGKAFDKAGGYAIQEGIGLVAVERIEGDYNNVVGLSVGDVVQGLETIAAGLATASEKAS
ncbi:MAG: septum formation protein Maf [Candidatus Dadabacteria bacterium]|nr:MAG: septum formation protein Maf [Candidatus Dadabacteria bacterium]